MHEDRMITGTVIDRLLRYDPEVGLFYRRRGVRGHAKGEIAGHIQINKQPNGSVTKYRAIRINGKSVLASRLAWVVMNGKWPIDEIDHKNGISTDDRYSNLRPATRCENSRNTKIRSDNKSGFKGVSWDRINRKFVARIRVYKGKFENLGRFARAEDAAAAYRRRAIELHGQFARFE